MLTYKEAYPGIARNIKFFVKTEEKVKLKFLVDMIRGILISKRVNLSAMSRLGFGPGVYIIIGTSSKWR